MERRDRSVWFAGLGLAAIAAAWVLHRTLGQDRDLRPAPELEMAVGQPARLMRVQRPLPRLRRPYFHRGRL